MRTTLRGLSLLMLFLLLATVAFGQAETGTIAGTVRDSTSAVVPGAKVSARNIATAVERAAETDNVGGYTIPGLLPGIYDVTITKSGFADHKTRAQVTVGSFVTVSAQLSLSAVTSIIEVVAAGGTEINTQSQEVSQIILPEQIQNLPSLTRNPYDFVALAGNVSGGDRGLANGNPQLNGAGQNGSDRGVGYSINGQRSSGTEVLLDGVENSNIFDTTIGLLVPQDAVQEYRVITNNFDAQYGRASGGVVNVATRSGGNTFHGDAWEFNRLSAYTANTFDNNAAGVPRGHYTRNSSATMSGDRSRKISCFSIRARSGCGFAAVRTSSHMYPRRNFWRSRQATFKTTSIRTGTHSSISSARWPRKLYPSNPEGHLTLRSRPEPPFLGW